MESNTLSSTFITLFGIVGLFISKHKALALALVGLVVLAVPVSRNLLIRSAAGPQTQIVSVAGSAAPVSASGPYHIPTWAYDEFHFEGEQASAADVVRILTYAETGPGNNKALNDCHSIPKGCKAIEYFNPNRIFDDPSCPSWIAAKFMAAAKESWFVHEAGYNDAAHRLRDQYPTACNGVPVNLNVWQVNLASTEVQSYFRHFLQSEADAFDLYYMDDTHAALINQFGGCQPGPYCSSTQELSSDNDVEQAAGSFVDAMRHRDGRPMDFVFNSISFNGRMVGDLRLFDASPHFVGASCEVCATSATIVHPENYVRILNTMAAFNKRARLFVLLSNGNAPTGSQAQVLQRFVTTGLVWLGLQNNHEAAWANLEYNTRKLAVWPEDMIYPSRPIQTMTTGADDLQVASKIWRREFTACYRRGKLFGRCAVVLNGSDDDVVVRASWLANSYSHLITTSGGDELSGGRESIDATPFASDQTTLPAHGALLLAQ